MLEKVYTFFKGFDHVEGAVVLVACSGGPDSTALLHSLFLLRQRLNLTLKVVYLDHGIRPRSERDQEYRFVMSLAETRDLPSHIKRLPEGWILHRAKASKKSVEEVAREERYAFFEELLSKGEGDYVALGHTRDDQVETVVFRFLRGSDPLALRGMSPVRDRYLRPLLSCSRSEVLSFLQEQGLSYLEDSSNEKDAYDRNFLRIHVLPVLEKRFPGWTKAVVALSEKAELYHRYLERRDPVGGFPIEETPSGLRVPFHLVSRADPLERYLLFYRLYQVFMSREGTSESEELPFWHIRPYVWHPESLWDGIVVGRGVMMRREGEYLVVRSHVVLHGENGYFVVIEKEGEFRLTDELRMEVRCGRHIPFEKGRPGANEMVLPVGTYVCRSRKAGDAVARGSLRRSVHKVFQMWNLPPHLRCSVPVLEAPGKGIVAILGGWAGYEDIFADPNPIPFKGDEDVLYIRLHHVGRSIER
ncbi:tRNA lysidine(34) synthetase TilS [Spirochaeta thermophila]|uniref:tRNA(Ile)-lysidine synthase n=1 Tax=Winmispira thermophila (strain ATCC 49972 / DSM 6192 / RI 19.B1) TaxID=665571 RepID=E0RSK0_WINT6|nr:tRNA lysidine(34) synthetase TilS [Spirochaeta thermophila]ADN01987.1 tRNA(Ile)-lysidine synthase [Spirochaeta thermophila DSM 6192]